MVGERSGLRGRGLLVVMACFLCHMGLGFTYLPGALQADVTTELGLGRASYSAATQVRNYVVALASPGVGLLLVRFGARPVLAGGVAILCGAALCLSGARDWWGLVFSTLILGIGLTAVGDVTVGHAVSRWVSRSRGSALGIVYTASNLGGMLLVPLVAGLSEAHSWREALRFAGFGALGLLPFAALVRSPRHDEVASELDASSEAHGVDMDLQQALRTRSFWILFFAHFAYFAYAVGVVEHFITYLRDAGVPRSEAANHWGRAIGLGIASKLAFGFLSDRIPARHGMLILLGAIALSSILLILAPRQPFLWLFVIVFGFSYAARDVVTPLIVIDCFGLRYMAQIYGAIFPTLLLGGSAGAILAGMCADWLGSYRPAFGGLAALNLAAFILVLALRRERDLVSVTPP